MSFAREFNAFALKGNVVDLAVAVVIGGAFGKIVSAVVDDLIMPVVGAVLPGGDWRGYTATPVGLKVGHLLGSILDFLLIALVLFVAVVKIGGSLKKQEAALPPPDQKKCPECLETVPAAARRCRACASVFAAVAVILLLLVPTPARAADPTFQYAKAEELAAATQPIKGVEWKVQARGGAIWVTGNARTLTLSGGGSASRKAQGNKVALEAGGAYARSSILVVNDADGDGLLTEDELDRASLTSAKNWAAKARYDRFFTLHNSAFVAALAGADKPAGKEIVGGGQVGYSRQLHKDTRWELVGELGYDFSYENLVAPGDAVTIHSGRAFASKTLTVSDTTAWVTTGELLVNLNEETTPLGLVDVGEDVRVNAKTALTTNLTKDVSFAFGFALRFDNRPAPMPPLALPFAPTFAAAAEKIDTTLEAQLVVNLI